MMKPKVFESRMLLTHPPILTDSQSRLSGLRYRVLTDVNSIIYHSSLLLSRAVGVSYLSVVIVMTIIIIVIIV